MKRYYSTQRPIGPGTFPKKGGTEKIVNFTQGKIYCEEIERFAWGYIEYSEPLTDKEAEEYELTGAGSKGIVAVGCYSDGTSVVFTVE